MKKETIVHVKFDREESKEYKKEILHAQLNLLKITRSVRNFREARMKELEKKMKIYQELKDMRKKVRSLETSLPKPKIPKIVQKSMEGEEKEEKEEEVLEKAKPEEKKKENKSQDEIEAQLLEIKEKLKKLH